MAMPDVTRPEYEAAIGRIQDQFTALSRNVDRIETKVDGLGTKLSQMQQIPWYVTSSTSLISGAGGLLGLLQILHLLK